MKVQENETQRFTTANGDYHFIDKGGNHFINGKCANPKSWEGEVGDSYPPMEERNYKSPFQVFQDNLKK